MAEAKSVVKSIGLLQAYGEFDRFMHMSKDYLKQKKNLLAKQKEDAGESKQQLTGKEVRTLRLYRDISSTLKYARQNKYDSGSVTNLILDPTNSEQSVQKQPIKRIKKTKI